MTIKRDTIIVVLKLEPWSVPRLIVRATSVVNAMTANKATFPGPTPALVQCTADIDALMNAEVALRSHTGTRSDRDDTRKLVVADMQSLHAYVQQIASANPAQASAIATDADMTLRKSTARHKAPLAVKQTVSGSVKVVAKVTAGARANAWQYSFDAGSTWLDVPPTTAAHVTIHGLTPGVVVTYRQRVLTKLGFGDWSQPISARLT